MAKTHERDISLMKNNFIKNSFCSFFCLSKRTNQEKDSQASLAIHLIRLRIREPSGILLLRSVSSSFPWLLRRDELRSLAMALIKSSVTDFFLIVESAFLNLLKNFREAETEAEFIEAEFPRVPKFFSLVSTADGALNEKIRDKKLYQGGLL